MKRTLGFLVLLGLLITATGCNGNGGNVKGSNHFKEYEFINFSTLSETLPLNEAYLSVLLIEMGNTFIKILLSLHS